MELSIVCVTQAADYAQPFLTEMFHLAGHLGAEVVLGLHGERAHRQFQGSDSEHLRTVSVEGRYLEEMLNPVLAHCTGDYILRLDDDERVPDLMRAWLRAGEYKAHDSWFFPRVHFWPDLQHAICTQPNFPDFQGRLTTREKSTRPTVLHAGQPYPAYRAPVYFEHHAFLAKSKEERRAITAHYESILTGQPFPVEQVDVVWPEDVKNDQIRVEAFDPKDWPRWKAKADRIRWWREQGESLPPALERQMVDWTSQERATKIVL